MFGALLLGMTASGAPKTQSIRDLDWLIGSWDFVDVSVTRKYRETGTRTCSYTLDEKYLVCQSIGTSQSGKERTYIFFLNYNSIDDRFEMVAMFGDYPRKNLYIVEVSENGHRLDLKNSTWTDDGLTKNNEATLTYDGESQYVWEIRSGEPDPVTGVPQVTYRDTVHRRRTLEEK